MTDRDDLLAALAPFAAVAERDIGQDEGDTDLFRPMSARNARAPLLTVGDFRRARSALAHAHPAPAQEPVAVPEDVVRLVLAARDVAFTSDPTPESIKELDQASEAFAERIPWDDEPLPEEGDDESAAPISPAADSGESGGLEEAVRLAEVGEYLFNAKRFAYGDGYTQPRELSISWEWQQSAPEQYGEGMLMAAATKWHDDQAEDGVTTEARKLRAALASHTPAAHPTTVIGVDLSSGPDYTAWFCPKCKRSAVVPAPPPAAGKAEVVASLPTWWRPSRTLAAELKQYRKVKADLADFDGDRRGISHALGEAEFRVLAAICADHVEDDECDHNGFVVSPMVEMLDRLASGSALATPPAQVEHGSLASLARQAAEEMRDMCARIADKWATRWQREFGDGGPAAEIRALPLPTTEPAFRPTHRHVKRGSEYRVIGEAEAQVSTGPTNLFGPLAHRPIRSITDGNRLTIYQGDDGKLWARFADEFNDGRFEPLSGED